MLAAACRRLVRLALRTVAVSAAALVLVTCTDNPVGPGRGGVAYLRLQPVFDAFSRVAPLVLDRIRVVVIRSPADTLADVRQSFSPASNTLQLNVPVRLERSTEDLEIHLELYSGSILLFSGMDVAPVTAGQNSRVSQIPVAYQGPGANIASLSLAPRDSTVAFGATVDMQASAVDAQQAPVAQFYLSWSASGGTIDATGRFTAPTVRDTVFVRGVTPTGIMDSTRVFVMAAPGSLVLVSGDAQSASIGTRLPLPLVVRVDGTDGQPVPGVQVAFAAVAGGGSVDSATATTDAQGLARTGATLGLTVGPQTFSATVPGLSPVTYTMTAASGGLRTWTGAVSTDWNTAGNWSPAALPGSADSVVIPASALNAPTLTGNFTIGAVSLQGTGATLQVSGGGILTVQRGIALPDTGNTLRGIIRAGSVAVAGYQALLDLTAGGSTVTGATSLSGDLAVIDARLAGHSFGPVVVSGNQAHFYLEGNPTFPSTSGPITVSDGDWNGWGATVTGAPAITLTGTGRAFARSGTVTVNGDVIVGGTSGQLANFSVGSPTTWLINGNLQTTAGGVLVMQSALDTVRVNGNASFGGGDETGQLTNGAVLVSGNFTQTGVATTFVATGSHYVTLNGSGTQTVSFAAPGFSGARFANLLVENSGSQIASDMYVTGVFGNSLGGQRVLGGNGSTLHIANLILFDWAFNNVLVDISFSGSGFVSTPALQNVAFQGYAPTATALTVSLPGWATTLQFDNVSFGVQPTSGFYLSATDTSPTDGVPVVIDMTNPSPLSAGNFLQVAGGATVNWPAGGIQPGTWTGTFNNDWSNGANWSNGQVPTAADDVTIPASTPFSPQLTSSCTTRNLTVDVGATLDLNGINCQVAGSVVADGPVTGAGAIEMSGPGTTVRGSLSGLTILNAVTLNGSTLVQGNLLVSGASANFDFGSTVMAVTGTFDVQGGAVFTMASPTATLNVAGNVTMNGGNTTGLLTAGTIIASDNFNVTSNQGFNASGTHRVVFNGSQRQSISFVSGQSRFNELDISGAAGGVFVTTSSFANMLISHPAAAPPVLSRPITTLQFQVTGADVSGLVTDGVPIYLGNGPITQFDNVTFQGNLQTFTQLSVTNIGAAPLTFNNLVFLTAPTTGHRVVANDADGPTSGVLTVNLVNPTPGTPTAQDTLTINGAVINWPAASPGLTWNGSLSADWDNPGNWTPNGVPNASTDVTIPSGASTQPTLSTDAFAANLTLQSGGTQLGLGAQTLQLGGNLVLDGAVTSLSGGKVVMAGANKTLSGAGLLQANLEIQATTLLGSDFSMQGSLTTSSVFSLNGHVMNVAGSFSTTSATGLLYMLNNLDRLVVSLNATFDGGDHLNACPGGCLSDGALIIGGNLTQLATHSPDSYHPSGNHLTVFTGANPTVSFATPGIVPGSSHFETVEWTAVGTMTLASDVYAHGDLFISSGSPPTIAGTDRLLQVGGYAGTLGLTLDGVRLAVDDPAGIGSLALHDITFQNMNAVATQLSVVHPGTGGPFTFTNLTFSTPPSAGGFYLSAIDAASTDGVPLVIDMVNPTPATTTAFQALPVGPGGAVINWPATGAVYTWTGAADNNWSNPGNWDLNAVPGVIDDAVLVPITNQPKLTSSVGINNLTLQAGAILDVDTTVLVIGGSLDNAGSITGVAGTGGVVLSGTGTVRGPINVDIVIPGSYTLNGTVLVDALSVSVAGSGSLDLAGNLLSTNNADFMTVNSGTLTMTDPNGFLDVGGSAFFMGGDETGKLTAGTIQVLGDFSQIGTTAPTSFVADTGFNTYLAGTAPVVTFTDPASSRFFTLAWGAIGGTLSLGSDITVLHDFSAPDGPATMLGSGHTLTAGNLFTQFLTVNDLPIVIDQPKGGIFTFVFGLTFTNMATTATQLTIRDPGNANGINLDQVAFDSLSTGATGLYLSAEDTDLNDAIPLQVNLIGATPADPTNGGVDKFYLKVTGTEVIDWNGQALP